MPPIITVLQPGDTTKVQPYTIAIIANPALETPIGSGVFVPDPILGDLPGFRAAVKYTFDVLFGRLPRQAENLLARMALGTFNVFGGSGAWSSTERRPANRVFTYPAR